MDGHDWLLVGLFSVGSVSQWLLWGDRFVHSTSAQVRSHEIRLMALERDHTVSSDRFSEKWGEIQAGIGRLELDVARLKALAERRSHER